MERTWKPKAAGILCIIAGVPTVIIPCIVVALNVGARGYPFILFGLFVAP
jgi:hypothetical protein